MLKGTDKDSTPHACTIAFLKRVFGSRSTAGRVATPQDLSVTKQHRNDRWDRCTASAGDWQIITTTSHRSANQRYFTHNSATAHRMLMQSSALDSSRSQLCNDTSTGVVRHQMTKRRRLQKVVSYDVLHHSCVGSEKFFSTVVSYEKYNFRLFHCVQPTKIVTFPREIEKKICPTLLFFPLVRSLFPQRRRRSFVLSTACEVDCFNALSLASIATKLALRPR